MLDKHDYNLARAVRRALANDALIPDRDIHVSVQQAWVALEGTVEHEREREQAEQIAARVEGIRGVSNALGVWPSDLESDVVEETLEEAFERRDE